MLSPSLPLRRAAVACLVALPLLATVVAARPPVAAAGDPVPRSDDNVVLLWNEASRLGDHGVTTLVADHDANGEIMLVRPDAHLGWRGRADPDAVDRWLTTVTRHGRAG